MQLRNIWSGLPAEKRPWKLRDNRRVQFAVPAPIQWRTRMSDGDYNILFLSTRNGAQSIFAEAVANRRGVAPYFSAGMKLAKHPWRLTSSILFTIPPPGYTQNPGGLRK
jgi:hypothetical protein